MRISWQEFRVGDPIMKMGAFTHTFNLMRARGYSIKTSLSLEVGKRGSLHNVQVVFGVVIDCVI